MTDNIIDEVLRHDAEMPAGKWEYGNGAVWPEVDPASGNSISEVCDFCSEPVGRGIAYYRTAAPKLARMVQQRDKALKRAMEALRKRIGCFGDGQANIEESALVDITKILSEP